MLLIVEPVRIYRRGRTPIYPYFYNPGRRGGYSFYFGFVPYATGDIENQAIQRDQYPQNIEWPPGLYGGPRRAGDRRPRVVALARLSAGSRKIA